MGLTIHYTIEAAPAMGAAEARRVVTEGRILAGRMSLRLALDEVGPMTWDEPARRAAACYRTFPVPGQKGTFLVMFAAQRRGRQNFCRQAFLNWRWHS
jgi:hypothetical protein